MPKRQSEKIDQVYIDICEIGVEAGLAHMRAVLERHPPDLVLAYASGLATGIAEFVAEIDSEKRAYDLFTEVADEIITPVLPEGE